LTVDRRDETGDLVDSYRIRIANHDCKPTYFKMAPFNFDVGEHQDADGDWLDAVHHACLDLEVETPARIARRRDKRNAAAAAHRAEQERQWAIARAERDAKAAAERSEMNAALEAVLPALEAEDWALLTRVGTVKNAHTDSERTAREAFSQRCQRRGLVVDRYLRERLAAMALRQARETVTS
jgi:hypothetical protein